MDQRVVGKVLGLAVRESRNSEMRELSEAAVVRDGGIQGDLPSSPDRGLTFLASAQWDQVILELGVELSWYVRRANVLVESPSLGDLIGRTISVGEVQVEIKAETEPCALMDRLYPGLHQALLTEFRGGVYGRVLTTGRFKLGDLISVVQ